MSDEKQADEPLTMDDLQVNPTHISENYLRELIEGLRALPNVSDLAVIKTITELDRIALCFEQGARKRERIVARAIKIAERHVAEGKAPAAMLVLMRTTGGVPPAIYQELVDEIQGDESAVHPTCDCPRCQAKRDKAASEGSSARLQ